MRYIISSSLLIVAVIHLLPLSGVLGADQLTTLYGIPIADPNLEILMRHRAVLFGLLGSFFLFAAFRPVLQKMAFVAGLISVCSFIWLAWSIGAYNPEIGRVYTADLIALASLIVGVIAYKLNNRELTPE